MMNLFEDSQEVMQRLWAQRICHDYPVYKEFWDEFIGERKADNRYKHYEINFPKEADSEEIRSLEEEYEDMCIVHYSNFYNLASALYKVDELKKILADKHIKQDWKYFLHWKCFNSVYSYLGNIFYLLERLYSHVLTIVNKKGKRDLIEYLKSKGLYEEFVQLKSLVKDKRDFIVHHSIMPSSIRESGYKIPTRLRDKRDRMKRAVDLLTEKKEDWIFTHEAAEQDWKTMVLFINKIDEFFLCELRELKKKGSLIIGYPQLEEKQERRLAAGELDGTTGLSSLSATPEGSGDSRP